MPSYNDPLTLYRALREFVAENPGVKVFPSANHISAVLTLRTDLGSDFRIHYLALGRGPDDGVDEKVDLLRGYIGGSGKLVGALEDGSFFGFGRSRFEREDVI